MADEVEAPKRIWISKDKDSHDKWSSTKFLDDDIKYIRHDRYHALLEAACSLHYHLFELKKLFDDGNPRSYEREMLDDAQLAIDKYNRFCDGVEEK